jgi:long-subunit fatty acid transport protein
MNRKHLLQLTTAMTVAMIPSVASADGLFSADSTGRIISPTSDGATVLLHTPSSLRLVPGNEFELDVSGYGRLITYARDTTARDGGEVFDTDTQFSVAAQPMAAYKRQLADTGLTFGIGIASPVWEKSNWGDESGQNRWHNIYSKMRAAQAAPAIAYTIPGGTVHLGGSVTVMRIFHHGYRAFDYGAQLGREKEVDDVPPEDPGNEGRVLHDLAGNTATASASITLTPSPTLVLAASYTSAATVSLEGDVNFYAPNNDLYQDRFGDQESSGTLELRLPHITRLSARFGSPNKTTFGVDAQFSSWMIQDTYCIEIKAPQGLGDPSERFETEWRPTFTGRLHLGHRLASGSTFSALAGFTSSAMPDDVISLALMDAHRVEAGVSYEHKLSDMRSVSFGYTHFLSLPREVEESRREPIANGTYNQQLGMLNAGFSIGFAPEGPRPDPSEGVVVE